MVNKVWTLLQVRSSSVEPHVLSEYFQFHYLYMSRIKGGKGLCMGLPGELRTAARMKVYWSTYYTYLASGGQISYTLNV